MNKLKNNKGFTLTELLAATLIMLLVSLGLATGVALSNKQFVVSIRESEAEELYSTLETILTNELRFTNDVVLKNNNEVKSFYSVTYNVKKGETSLLVLDNEDKAVIGDKYGQLALGNSSSNCNRLIGSGNYSYDMGAKANIIYDINKKIFTVTLSIGRNVDTAPIVSHTFNVRPLNDITVRK